MLEFGKWLFYSGDNKWEEQTSFLENMQVLYLASSINFKLKIQVQQVCKIFNHYNNRGLFCEPHIIANNKERSFWKPAFANHNSLQNLKPLQYQNIRTCTIASPSQLPNLKHSQNFSDYNYFYILFAINITSKTICNKPITATT